MCTADTAVSRIDIAVPAFGLVKRKGHSCVALRHSRACGLFGTSTADSAVSPRRTAVPACMFDEVQGIQLCRQGAQLC